MRWLRLLGSWLLSRPIENDFQRAWRLMRDNPATVVLALGVLVRSAVYYENRGYGLDEGSLSGNIVGVRALDFSQPLSANQLAPHGFLIVQRALASSLGPSRYVTRLLPLVSGLAAIFFFSLLARRILPPRPALVALVLFAFSDDLIHYASELKPYSLDLALGLAITLTALRALGEPARERQAAALAVLAVIAPWFSFASAFIIAGCGLTLILLCLLSRRYRDAMIWGMLGMLWLASFVACYRASRALVSPYIGMHRFWYFAFLPVCPLPMSLARLGRSAGILLEIFVNPLNLVAPVWPWLGVVLPVLLLLAGGVWLARRSWSACALLVLPIALATVASAMERYPLHGRLIHELVPAFFLLIAAGTERLRELDLGRAKLVYKLALFLLLLYPCLAALNAVAFPPLREFNSHGDLHRNIFLQFGEPTMNPSL
jgi:hypothetical protein